MEDLDKVISLKLIDTLREQLCDNDFSRIKPKDAKKVVEEVDDEEDEEMEEDEDEDEARFAKLFGK